MNSHDTVVATLIPSPIDVVEFHIQGLVKEIADDLKHSNESYIEIHPQDGLCYHDAIACGRRIQAICESKGWNVDLEINSINNRNRWVMIAIAP